MEMLDAEERKIVNLIVDKYLDIKTIKDGIYKFQGVFFHHLLTKIPNFYRLGKVNESYALISMKDKNQDDTSWDLKEILKPLNKLNMIYLDLIQFLYFLSKLEQERLIIIHKGQQQDFLFRDYSKNSEVEEYVILDRTITSLIDKYWTTEIIPTRYLIELKNNDFRTPEQRRFEIQMSDTQAKFDKQMSNTKDKFDIQMKSARKVLYISWAAFVVAFISSGYQIYTTETSKNTMKIDESQIESIINSIREDKTNMYPPIEISFKDTIKVRNVNN